MLSTFLERTKRLHEMPKKSCEVFWWPFTQHKLVPEEKVTVIDSRCGENFAVLKVGILILLFGSLRKISCFMHEKDILVSASCKLY